MGSGTSGMHDPLRNAFVIEAMDLLTRNGVFQKRRTSPQTVLRFQPAGVSSGFSNEESRELE
jgi:hypothetical protein